MKVHFLEASVPLTKTYVKNHDGTIKKTPYPFVWDFTSHDENPKSLSDLEAVIKKHAALNHCLLKGNISRPLVKESRAGATQSNDSTEFVVLDLDGLPDRYTQTNVVTPSSHGVTAVTTTSVVAVTIDYLLACLGLDQYSHIIQWSASYGLENTKLRAHVFFMLDKPMAAPLLKQWLIQKNHEVALLRDAMELTKTGNMISWPLDTSACQNDKLIYIAPPVLKGIKDPMTVGTGKAAVTTLRISLSKRAIDLLSINSVVNSTAKNKELTGKRLEVLRDIAGLPKRKTTYKMHGSVEVMVKPDSCTITDMKTERGFVYFNLNGGDSWAYYHPESNPDYVFNFKGEPAYLTKELLPDYWQQLTSTGARSNSSGVMFLAFCDRATGAYWRGTFDSVADVLDIYVAKNETQVRHFAKQHGLPLGDFIPEWDVVFDPHGSVRVDFGNRTVNVFTLTTYMKAVAKPRAACPPTIYRIIHHALGSDPEKTERFINWIAYILQYRDRAKTAWVLNGVPGTGKGILCTNILRPIFGTTQTTARRMEELNEPYNPWMKRSFLVFIDEVQTKALQNERGVMAKLKNFITEESVAIREMYTSAHEARNRTSWLFNSNMPDPILIEKGDRRFNVGGYQAHKLVVTDKDMTNIEGELQAFHDYLLFYKVNVDKVFNVMESKDRNIMMEISESSVDTVADKLLGGNFTFFMDQLPTDGNYVNNAVEVLRVAEYEAVLKALLARTDRNTGACSIGREELRTLFQYTVGGMPTTPNKFTSLLKHHRVHIGPVWIAPKTTNGIKVIFQDLASWPTHLAQLSPASAKPAPAARQARLHDYAPLRHPTSSHRAGRTNTGSAGRKQP